MAFSPKKVLPQPLLRPLARRLECDFAHAGARDAAWTNPLQTPTKIPRN